MKVCTGLKQKQRNASRAKIEAKLTVQVKKYMTHQPTTPQSQTSRGGYMNLLFSV